MRMKRAAAAASSPTPTRRPATSPKRLIKLISGCNSAKADFNTEVTEETQRPQRKTLWPLCDLCVSVLKRTCLILNLNFILPAPLLSGQLSARPRSSHARTFRFLVQRKEHLG